MHVFVHHAEDAQGHALAAIVRHCDAQTHGQFRFLVVEGHTSIQRMKRFLHKQHLSAEAVRLPFVVLIQQDSQAGSVRRSVLHGAALQQWLAEMVDALIHMPGFTPLRARQMFLDPFISPHILRLSQYAAAPSSEHPPPPPPVVELPNPPMRPSPEAFVEELVDSAPAEPEGMLLDEGVSMHYHDIPVPRKEERGGKGKAQHDHLKDAKARESMIQNKTWK